MYMCDMCVPTKYTCTNIVQSHCNLQEYYYLAKKEKKKRKEKGIRKDGQVKQGSKEATKTRRRRKGGKGRRTGKN